MPRINTLHSHSAYVKIAEGCDHNCAFCIIPAIRGRLRSRPLESVVKEVENLVAGGVVEINLVAQDLAAYGRDLKQPHALLELLKQLVTLKKLQWIRLLYAYPENLSEDFLTFFAQEPKILKYLDIPMQHGSTAVLKRMKRCVTREQLIEIIRQVRAKVPGVTLRTSTMVGFPGETHHEFEELLSFVEELKFDHLGCFLYSQESGTVAGAMKDQIPESIKIERREKVMALQSKISASKLKKLRTNKQQAFIEKIWKPRAEESFPQGFSPPNSENHRDQHQIWQARLASQAPEVDGLTYVLVPPSYKRCRPGALINVTISETHHYDVLAYFDGDAT